MIKQFVVGIVITLGLSQVAFAKPRKETLDVTTFTPPAGWKRVEHEGAAAIEYSTANEKAGAAASVIILRSTPAAGDARANFDSAWANFVTPVLTDAPPPTIAPASSRGGWQLVSGTSAYVFEGRAARTTVLTATRDATFVIIIATRIGKRFDKDVDRLLASLAFAAPAPPVASPPVASPAATTAVAGDLAGAWGFSTGGAMGSDRYAAWLSDRREYTFDGKGSYTFLRRLNIDREPDTSIIRERGTYTLVAGVLTLTPSKSEREVWSKVKSGANAGAYDKLLSREKVALESAAYSVAFTVYLDTQVPNLMLGPSAATQRDGNFNATTSYRLFRPDGNYYTAIPPTP